MRQLFLMRHAKTERSSPAGDHARKLVERGHDDIGLIASELTRLGLAPDHALASDAMRTTQTVSSLKQHMQLEIKITLVPELYLAEPQTILHEIWAAPDDARALIVVGHNPGLHELAYALAGKGAKKLLNMIAMGFPTAALAGYKFNVDSWADIAPGQSTLGKGPLGHFFTAKQLRESNAAVFRSK